MDRYALYHRLPYALRVAAASAAGCRRHRWRYGPETELLVAEALTREAWSAPQWHAWQQARSAAMLHHAATRVPFYRAQWQARRRAGDRAAWDRIEHWPLLDKQTLRAQPRAFLADGAERQRLYPLHTSGSTGTPLTLWQNRAASRAWYALFEARWRHWNGVSRHDRWAIIGGQMVAQPGRKRPPFWVWNRGLRQLYLSAEHISAASARAYLDALHAHQVRYLWGYASALASLAGFAHEQGLTPPPLAVVLSNAEPLYPHQRAAIERAFNCPVRNTYGMAEIVAAGSECRHASLHLWPEAGVVEVLDDRENTALPAGTPGRLVCTGLLNDAMPLIRYGVGDRATLRGGDTQCACRRGLPVLAAIEGRLDDVVVTPDGRRVGRLDLIFKTELAICEAQIIQETPGSVRVRVVPAPGFGARDVGAIIAALHERVGPMQVEVEKVAAIARGPNGKFRAVISLPDNGSSSAAPHA